MLVQFSNRSFRGSKDAIINRIEINRSMIVAVEAIEQVEARAVRRAQLPGSVGKVWTDEEVHRLKEEFAASEPIRSSPQSTPELSGRLRLDWNG